MPEKFGLEVDKKGRNMLFKYAYYVHFFFNVVHVGVYVYIYCHWYAFDILMKGDYICCSFLNVFLNPFLHGWRCSGSISR